MEATLRRLGLALTFLLPVFLLHARAGADIAISAIDVLFLVQLGRTGGWSRLRQPWLLCAAAFWLWEVVCSIPGIGGSGWRNFWQAVVLARLLILPAALSLWLLAPARHRRTLWVLIALAALWIGVESWQQILTGANLFGDRRWPDGALTGPFWEPRAGAPYAHLLCVALLPVVIPLLARRRAAPRLAGIALTVLALATTILIGQRMPTLLALLSLFAACLFIPRLALPAGIAASLGAILLALTPILSPPTYQKLVLHFWHQMRSFPVSPYGELYTRALAMARQSPWHGFGFNGFKVLCPQARFATGIPGLGIAPTQLALGACNIHPHNFYLQALTDAGLPGLCLFAGLNLAWLLALARRPPAAPRSPLQVGVFAAVLTFAWPLASTDSFATLPHAGWLVLLVGLGLATSQFACQPNGIPDRHA